MLSREDVTIGMEVAAVKDAPSHLWVRGLRRGIIEEYSPLRDDAVMVKFLNHKNRDWIGHTHACGLSYLIPFHSNHINQSLNDSLVALFED